MRAHLCLPRGWLGKQHSAGGPGCSCGVGAGPFEPHRPGCDRTRVPYLDGETSGLVEDAVESLVLCRGASQGDAGAALSCLTSLIAELQSQLPAVVAEARCQDYNWEEIAHRLATPARTARRRYGRYASWWASLPSEED